MKDQHTKIKGYRDLSQEEIDLMNEVKGLEAKFLDLHQRISAAQIKRIKETIPDDFEWARSDGECNRWLKIAQDDTQKGFMALVRSIALPGMF